VTAPSPLIALQHAVLRIAKKARLHGRTMPFFHPRCTVLWSDALPGLYGDIFIEQDYAPPRPLPPRPRILDIGAFLGLASIYFLWRFPDCRLVCVEPNPHAFDAMRRAVAGFAAGRGAEVAFHNKAVGVADGSATLIVDRAEPVNIAASLTDRVDARWNREPIAVEVIGLAGLLAGGVDFMKLDVEGMEYPLLQSGLIEPGRVRGFAVELHDVERHQSEIRSIAPRLLASGYRAVDRDGRALSAADIAAITGCRIVRFHAAD
jgi:FkbM family methyltransferase